MLSRCVISGLWVLSRLSQGVLRWVRGSVTTSSDAAPDLAEDAREEPSCSWAAERWMSTPSIHSYAVLFCTRVQQAPRESP
jgi:hypothetical protein